MAFQGDAFQPNGCFQTAAAMIAYAANWLIRIRRRGFR